MRDHWKSRVQRGKFYRLVEGVMEGTVIKFDYTDIEDSNAADMEGMEYLDGTD
jgi:hypothetical protein